MAMTTYTLRILGRLPDSIPLDRLGRYIQEFADLLGPDNDPRFSKIKNASIGIVAKVPDKRRAHTAARLREAQKRPESRPGRAMHRIALLLGEDHSRGAIVLDADGKEVATFAVIAPATDDTLAIRQTDSVDGIVTGLIGSDDTMNLHLRDDENRDINLVIRDMDLARQILPHFRRGVVRVIVEGLWERSVSGWTPKPSKCVVRSFVILENSTIRESLDHMASVPDNGWDTVADPLALWKELRGIH